MARGYHALFTIVAGAAGLGPVNPDLRKSFQEFADSLKVTAEGPT